MHIKFEMRPGFSTVIRKRNRISIDQVVIRVLNICKPDVSTQEKTDTPCEREIALFIDIFKRIGKGKREDIVSFLALDSVGVADGIDAE